MPSPNNSNIERSNYNMNGKHEVNDSNEQQVGVYQTSSNTNYSDNQNHTTNNSINSSNYSLLVKNIKSTITNDGNGSANKKTLPNASPQTDEYSLVWEKVVKMSELECKLNRVATTYDCNAIKQNSGDLNSWAAVMTIADQPNQVIGTFCSRLEAIRRATCAAIIMESNVSIPSNDTKDENGLDAEEKIDRKNHSKSLGASPSSRSSSPDPPLAELIRGDQKKTSRTSNINSNTSLVSTDHPIVELIRGDEENRSMNLKSNVGSSFVPKSLRIEPQAQVQAPPPTKMKPPSIPKNRLQNLGHSRAESKKQPNFKLPHENAIITVNDDDDQNEEMQGTSVIINSKLSSMAKSEQGTTVKKNPSIVNGYRVNTPITQTRMPLLQHETESHINYKHSSSSDSTGSVQALRAGVNNAVMRKNPVLSQNGMKFPPFRANTPTTEIKLPMERTNKLKSTLNPNIIILDQNKSPQYNNHNLPHTYQTNEHKNNTDLKKDGKNMPIPSYTMNTTNKPTKTNTKTALLQLLRHSYPCEMSDPETNQVVDVFCSIHQAQSETRISRAGITNACRKGGAMYAGKFWRYLTKEELFLFLQRVRVEGTRFSINKSDQFHRLLAEYSSLSRQEQVRPALLATSTLASSSKRKFSPPLPSSKKNDINNDDFDATSLLPLHPQKVTKRVKKYVELVENRTSKVLVCFRGNLDAGRALGLDRKKVGRACQSYGAPFEIKFRGYHLRYKRTGQPLVAYEYGKHREDFIEMDESHEQRTERWRRTFLEDLKNPPTYPYQDLQPQVKRVKKFMASSIDVESINGKEKDGSVLSHLNTNPDINSLQNLHAAKENDHVGVTITEQDANSHIHNQNYEEKTLPLSSTGNTRYKETNLPKSILEKDLQTSQSVGTNDWINKVAPNDINTPHLKPPMIQHRQDIDVTYAHNEISLKNIVEKDETKASDSSTVVNADAENSTMNGNDKLNITTYLHPSTPVTYQKPSKRHKYDNLCLICQEAKAQVIFHPCHHCILCSNCNKERKHFPKFCPTCRMEIHDRVLTEFATFARPRIYSAYSFM